MRGFPAFWTARTISMVGTSFSTFAVPVYLYDAGASAVVIGLVLAAKAAPALLAPAAGVLADRVDPRRIMIVCDLGQFLTAGAIAVLLPPVPMLVGLVVVSSLLGTTFLPAGKSTVPRLVPRERLGRANALLGVSGNLAFAVGPLLGAVVYQFAGARAAFAADAASYAISAVFLLLVPRLAPADRTARRVWAELREGFAYVAADRTVRAVAIGLLLGVAFAAMDNTALVFLVRDELSGGPGSLGLALGVFGAGMVLVPLVLLGGARRPSVPGVLLLAGGLAVSGVGLVLAGVAGSLVLAVLAYGLAGAGNGLENIGTDTAIGEQVPSELLGRVFGAVYAPLAAADVVASALAGPLLEATSARVVFLVAGVGSVGVALVVALLTRPPRRRSSTASAVLLW